jgi:multidrug efflux pump subunit AcrB
MYHGPNRSSGTILSVMKLLVGAGIVIITIALILFFNDMLSPHSPSVYLQLAVAGVVVMVMSFLAIKVFRGLEFV